MQTIQQERQYLAQKAQQFQAAMRKKLEQGLNLGGDNNMAYHRSPHHNTTPDGRIRTKQAQAGATMLKMGIAPTDAQVLDAIKKAGGNPYSKALAELDKKAAASRQTTLTGPIGRDVNRAAAKAEKTLLEQLAEEYKQSAETAKQANLNRYAEGHFELSDLRNRNTERVKNWGEASRQDLEERFSQNLGEVTANLSGRGLGNSTIVSAFEAKNARDLAREQLRLSEQVDDRQARYDSTDTRSLVDFVERRNDVAPDASSLMALAQAYGASGAGGVGGQEAAPLSELQALGYERPRSAGYATGGVSPYVANRIAAGTNGSLASTQEMMNPLGMIGSVMGGVRNMVGSPGAVGSNAFPAIRTAEQISAAQGAGLQRLEELQRSTEAARRNNANYQSQQYEAAYGPIRKHYGGNVPQNHRDILSDKYPYAIWSN